MERITYKHYIDTPVLDMYVIFDCYEPDDAIDAKCMFIQLFDTETPCDSTENIVFPYSTQTLVQYFSETVSGIVAIVLIQSSELRSSTSRLIVVLCFFFHFEILTSVCRPILLTAVGNFVVIVGGGGSQSRCLVFL